PPPRPRSSVSLFPYTTLFRSLQLLGPDLQLLALGFQRFERTHVKGESARALQALGKSGEVVAQQVGIEHGVWLWRWGDHYRPRLDRKSTRLNSSHVSISYAVF